MSSRKSSRSRKSSKRDSKSPIVINDYKDNKVDVSKGYGGFIFTLVLQGLIIYYLYNLEGVDCNCINDWRHNYIKYFAIFLICWYGLHIIVPSLSKKYIALTVIIMILSLINFYAFFTYIGDLNATKCICAVDKQPTLNSFLNFVRWFQLIGMLFAILFIVWFLLFMRSMLGKVIGK
jgi:hypothetical protein